MFNRLGNFAVGATSWRSDDLANVPPVQCSSLPLEVLRRNVEHCVRQIESEKIGGTPARSLALRAGMVTALLLVELRAATVMGVPAHHLWSSSHVRAACSVD
jgi:hypothetical protein